MRFFKNKKEKVLETKVIKVNVGKALVKVTNEDNSVVERAVIGHATFKDGKLVGNTITQNLESLNPVAKILFEPFLIKNDQNNSIELKKPKAISIISIEENLIDVNVPIDFKV